MTSQAYLLGALVSCCPAAAARVIPTIGMRHFLAVIDDSFLISGFPPVLGVCLPPAPFMASYLRVYTAVFAAVIFVCCHLSTSALLQYSRLGEKFSILRSHPPAPTRRHWRIRQNFCSALHEQPELPTAPQASLRLQESDRSCGGRSGCGPVGGIRPGVRLHCPSRPPARPLPQPRPPRNQPRNQPGNQPRPSLRLRIWIWIRIHCPLPQPAHV